MVVNRRAVGTYRANSLNSVAAALPESSGHCLQKWTITGLRTAYAYPAENAQTQGSQLRPVNPVRAASANSIRANTIETSVQAAIQKATVATETRLRCMGLPKVKIVFCLYVRHCATRASIGADNRALRRCNVGATKRPLSPLNLLKSQQ